MAMSKVTCNCMQELGVEVDNVTLGLEVKVEQVGLYNIANPCTTITTTFTTTITTTTPTPNQHHYHHNHRHHRLRLTVRLATSAAAVRESGERTRKSGEVVHLSSTMWTFKPRLAF